MAFRFNITPGSVDPIYKQIVDQVRIGVATGQLEVGTQLPSVRSVAEELLINPNTVGRAYADLAREGILESRHGRGAFIGRPRKMFTRQERLRRLQPFIDRLIQEARVLQFDPAEVSSLIEESIEEWSRETAKGEL